MNLNALRYLDRKIGIPLCYFFYFFKKFLFLSGRHKFEKQKVKKILVIKIWGLGSIILASPLFKNLRENFPNAEIWFLTQEGFERIYPSKFFNRIETMKLGGILNAIPGFLRQVLQFRREKFDLAIDLEIVSRYTALLSYLSGAKIKVGFEIMGQNKDKLYDYKAIYHESRHISKTFLKTMETLGMDVKSYLPFSPEFSHQAQQMVNDLLAKKKVSGRYIAVNINASELAYERRLPQSCFKSIIDNIFDKYSRYSVVLIGSKQEKEYVQDFLNNFPSDRNNIFDFSGLLSLPELFALLKNARLVISNDSGPAQAASAFNTPLVVFFGPETPVIYGPLGDNVRIFYSGTHCSPCISVYRDKKIKCNYRQKCLTDLDINEINKAVEEFLQQ